MNQILVSVPLPELLEQFRKVIKDEIKKENQQSNEEKLLSSEEACKVFQPKISRTTLQAWTDLGHLKSYRLGGRVYYKQTEIIESAKHLKRYKTPKL